MVIDFASCRGEEIARIIGQETEGLDLGILINNVGVAYPYARFLHEVDSQLMESVVRVNVEGTTWVTRTVISSLPETLLDWCLFKYFLGMRARGLRKDSRIEHFKDHRLK